MCGDSIELGVEMRDVAVTHGERVAYNIGGKVLTCTDLIQLSLIVALERD